MYLPRGVMRQVTRQTVRRSWSLRPTWGRRAWDLMRYAVPMPAGVSVTPVSVGGVECERITHPASGNGTLLYLHGGGYRIGSPRSHRALAARLALGAGADALLPDYRLAPEHPYPAGLEDALACVSALSADGGLDRVVFAGDSAGGGLALAACQARKAAGDSPPAGLALISPWVDLTASGETTRTHDGIDAILRHDILAGAASDYAGGINVADPRVSPLFGDLTGLPPILIHTGAEELFVSEGRDLAARVEAAGGAVTYEEIEGMWHVFHVHGGTLKEADEAIAAMAAWIADRLNSS